MRAVRTVCQPPDSRTAPGVADTVTDPVDGMLKRTRARATKLGKEITATKAGAEELPFEDGSFDTVLASLVLCSVPSQDRALAEMGIRVPN